MTIARRQMEEMEILSPSGQLDAIGYVELVESLDGCIKEGRFRILLDMEKVTYINSICISYIVQYWREVTREGGFLGICRPRGEVARLLRVGGIDKYIPVFEEPEAALRSLRDGGTEVPPLDASQTLSLLTNFTRVSLANALNCTISVGDAGPVKVEWTAVDLEGDVEGTIGLAITPEDSQKIGGLLLSLVPGGGEKTSQADAIDHIVQVMFDAALSGLEEVGYEFTVKGAYRRVHDFMTKFALLSVRGCLVIGVELRRHTTKRINLARLRRQGRGS